MPVQSSTQAGCSPLVPLVNILHPLACFTCERRHHFFMERLVPLEHPAIRPVVIHQSDRLHKRKRHSGTHELEPSRLQRLGQLHACFRGMHPVRTRVCCVVLVLEIGSHVGARRSGIDSKSLVRVGRRVLPQKINELKFSHIKNASGVVDRSFDLGPTSNDLLVLCESFDGAIVESCDFFNVKSRKGLLKFASLSKHAFSRQSALEKLERHGFENTVRVVVRSSPFLVVIFSHVRIRCTPTPSFAVVGETLSRVLFFQRYFPWSFTHIWFWFFRFYF